jgi:rubrerythrin
LEKDQFLEFMRQRLNAAKAEMESCFDGPKHAHVRACGRYEAYEEIAKHYQRLQGTVKKRVVKYKWICPECGMEILGDNPDARFECGDCSCRPWDNGGKDVEMKFVGEVIEWSEEVW